MESKEQIIRTILYAEGDTFKVVLYRLDNKKKSTNYITVDGVPYEVISSKKINTITITPEMNEFIKPDLLYNQKSA